MTDAAPEHGVNAQGEGTGPAAQKPSGITAPPEMARPQMKQMLTPEGAQAEGTAAGQGMKPMRTEPAAPAAVAPAPAPVVDPQVAYKAKLAQYDTARQAALDEMTADGKERADRIAYAKQNFVQANPYGSAGNHPGIGGKILHGLARTGEIAADIAAPGLTQAIPGTPERMAREQAGTQATLEKDVASEAQLDKPDKSKQYEFKESTDDKGNPVWIGINKTNPADVVQTHNPAFVKDAEGKPTDQASFVAKYKKDNNLPDTAESDAKAIQAYHASEAPPTTLMVPVPGQPGVLEARQVKPGEQVSAEAAKPGAAATEANKFKGKTLYFDTPEGRVAHTAEEAKAEGLDPTTGVIENEGQVSKDREKNSTFNVIHKSLDQYQTDMEKHPVGGEDLQQLLVLTGDKAESDYVTKILSGIADDIMGKPVTGYTAKLQGGLMDKEQYDKMSPAARQLLADYYTTMMAHFANMKAAQGTIPRNPYIIQTEMHTIPKPYLSTEEAKPAFQNYQDQVAMRNSDNVKFAPKKGEEKPEETAAPKEATHIVQGPDGNMHYTNEAGTKDYGLAPATK